MSLILAARLRMRRADRSHRLTFLLATALASITWSAATAFAAASIDLVPVRDNTLYEDVLGGASNGAGEHCFAGMTFSSSLRRSLFAFDLSAIPAGSIILTAEFRLTLDRAPALSGTPAMTLHRMTSSWGEGTSLADPFGGGSGAVATANDATWLHRFYPTDLWTQPGGDYDPAVLATSVVPETVGPYQWGSTPELVFAVQSWLNTPGTNFGCMLRGDETAIPSARRFFTREATNTDQCPHLFITYTALSASEPPAAHTLRFDPAVPNPFNPSTMLRWDAPAAGLVRITVWDARGAVVAQPFAGERPAGPQSLVWQAYDARGKALPSGVYVVRLQHGGQTRSQRVVLVR